MKVFIVLSCIALALAKPQGYNYNAPSNGASAPSIGVSAPAIGLSAPLTGNYNLTEILHIRNNHTA